MVFKWFCFYKYKTSWCTCQSKLPSNEQTECPANWIFTWCVFNWQQEYSASANYYRVGPNAQSSTPADPLTLRGIWIFLWGADGITLWTQHCCLLGIGEISNFFGGELPPKPSGWNTTIDIGLLLYLFEWAVSDVFTNMTYLNLALSQAYS